MKRFFALLLAFLAAVAVTTPAAAEPQFPELTGRVVDDADILPPDVEASLTEKLAALEAQSGRQLVVATIPDLQGYSDSDYGYQLGRAWGIGTDENDDGALLIVAPNERKVRIEVGYGLEPIMTDGLSALIIQQTIIPKFKEGNMAGGIVDGADAIIQQLQLPEDQAREIAAKAQERPERGGFPIGAVIWIMFIVFFVVLPMIGRATGRRYRRRGIAGAVGDVILWNAIGHAMGSGGRGHHSSGGFGGFGGGGFGGGGGFSGGGGSFGGGGASGSW